MMKLKVLLILSENSPLSLRRTSFYIACRGRRLQFPSKATPSGEPLGDPGEGWHPQGDGVVVSLRRYA